MPNEDKPELELVEDWDCWKQLLHEESNTQPSKGRVLKDILEDRRIKSFELEGDPEENPVFIITNFWNEIYKVEFLASSSNQLVGHVTKMN
jgi:hypothetical protein